MPSQEAVPYRRDKALGRSSIWRDSYPSAYTRQAGALIKGHDLVLKKYLEAPYPRRLYKTNAVSKPGALSQRYGICEKGLTR